MFVLHCGGLTLLGSESVDVAIVGVRDRNCIVVDDELLAFGKSATRIGVHAGHLEEPLGEVAVVID